ncbi:MAG: hypothetical protein HYW89_02100 [Candidatus Sungiibacteriota bacterium]|uniref:Uncharacterized protein n=1 Tax=Candidatus Sungiibacteriota bacterium TaxID=2750080 RepID=A0A7T5UQZ8_9BACT|nr:MAG: hypothetical protein HYW89_02100 [Candidatus Sungbacteria bacterium]
MPETSGPKSSSGPDPAVMAITLLLALGVLGVYLNTVLSEYTGFVEWVYAKNWGLFFRIFQVSIILLDLVLLVFLIFTLRKLFSLRRVQPEKEIVPHVITPKEEVKESWGHIRELANSSSPSDWNMAVLRADALLDDILTHLGYEGTTLAERLKIVDPTKLPSLERAWSSHRLRNAIAHDPLEQHTRETIIHALRSYEQALKELGMMEEEEQVDK